MSEPKTAEKPIIGRLEEISTVLGMIIERSARMAEFLVGDATPEPPRGVGKLGGAVGELDCTVVAIGFQCDEIERQMNFIHDALTAIFGRQDVGGDPWTPLSSSRDP